jgi:hypothetical protein
MGVKNLGIVQKAIGWLQAQCGTAQLEENDMHKVLRGINGWLLQSLAMYFPMTPAMRVQLQRARGVRIGRQVFLGIEVFTDPSYPELATIGEYASLAGRNIIFAHSDPTLPIRQESSLSAAGAVVTKDVTGGCSCYSD